MIVNCSVNAEHAKFTQTTVKRSSSDVPTDSSLFVISDDNKTKARENDDDDTKSTTLFFNNNDGGDNQNETISESSQRAAAVDFVLLPEFLANQSENRHENSKPNQSIHADPRQQHKRMADTQDMCDTSDCECKIETKFLTVDCHFQQVSNSQLTIHSMFIRFNFPTTAIDLVCVFSSLVLLCDSRHRYQCTVRSSCVLHIVVEYRHYN